VHLQRIVVHGIPVERGARTADVANVHAEVVRPNLRFYHDKANTATTTQTNNLETRYNGRRLIHSIDAV